MKRERNEGCKRLRMKVRNGGENERKENTKEIKKSLKMNERR